MLSDSVMLRRTFRYRIYPTAKHRLALAAQLAFACELYNAALEQRQDAWRSRRRSVDYVAQCRDLTDIRAHALGPKGMSCHAMRDPLHRVDRSFAAFFRRLKSGETPGYPRFRSRRRYDSLTWDQWVLRNGRLGLRGIGHLKVRWHRPLRHDSQIRTVTVRRQKRSAWIWGSRPSPHFPTENGWLARLRFGPPDNDSVLRSAKSRVGSVALIDDARLASGSGDSTRG